MSPRRFGSDPRLPLLIAVPLLIAAGLGGRALVGLGPETGHRLNRAAVWARSDRVAPARADLRDLLLRGPEDPRVWERGGRLLLSLGEPLEATLWLRRAAAADTASYRARYQLASALEQAGFPAQAEAALAEVFTRKPDHADALYLGAALAARDGRVEESVVTMARALAHGPTHPGRYRWDSNFDPVRNDRRFVRAVRALTQTDVFVVEEES